MVGKKIKELRLASSLTLKQLGNLLGYSESYLSLVESGVRSLSTRDLEKLAKYFNVSYSHLSSLPELSHQRTEGNKKISTTEEDKIAKDFLEYIKKNKLS